MLSQLLEGCYNVPLLFARSVDVAEEEDLPMVAGHKEDTGSIVPLGISFLSLLVGGLKCRLASVNHVLWHRELRSCTRIVLRVRNHLCDRIDLGLWDEKRRGVADGPVSSRTEVAVAETAICTQLHVSPAVDCLMSMFREQK
jgi:hypothetical protein